MSWFALNTPLATGARRFIHQRVVRMFQSYRAKVTPSSSRSVQTPVLVLPDDTPPHPYAVAIESAMLAPKSEMSLFPWKQPPERIPLAVRQVRSFLKAHRPV